MPLNDNKNPFQVITTHRPISSDTAPTDAHLPRSIPEAEGVSSAGIQAFLDAVQRIPLALHSLMVVRHGKVIAEGWWKPYAPDLKHTLYSITKSFTSTAIGMAVDEGHLRLEDTVISFFPNKLPEVVTPHLAAMQVRHLLTMTSGFDPDPWLSLETDNPSADYDWAREILAHPVPHAPESRFAYQSAEMVLLSLIFQRATGENLHAYLKPRLFEPLGIEGEDWESFPQGDNTGGWGLRLKTEDIAKFGQLYLQKGIWKGRRLLSEGWIAQATSKQTDSVSFISNQVDWEQGYGFLFWHSRHNTYRADGVLGQFCIILPEEDAVIAITAEDDNTMILNLVWEHLVPAFHDAAMADDPEWHQYLTEELSSLQVPFPATRLTSPLTEQMTGKTYTFSENALGIRRITLAFENDACAFRMLVGEGESEGWQETVCGIGTWIQNPTMLSVGALHMISTSEPPVTRLAASGAWRTENTFVIHRYFTETAHYDIITCRFEGNLLHLQTAKSIIFSSLKTPLIGTRE